MDVPWWWGRGRGWGWRWMWWWSPAIAAMASRGYVYIGPCRCGFGPNAYYMTPSGQIVHAWQLFGYPAAQWAWWGIPTTPFAPMMAPSVEDEKKFLEEQKILLERELKEIERRLKELKGGF